MVAGRRRKRVVAPLAAATALGSVAAAPALLLDAGVAQAYTFPGNTAYSYYISNLNTSTMQSLGCTVGQNNAGGPHLTDATVILDFGAQTQQGGAWGVLSPGGNAFHNDSDVYAAAKNFGKGYYLCTPGGYDLKLHVGTNNGGIMSSAAGTEWGTVIKNINAWLSQQGYGGLIHARGANDVEPSFANNYAGVNAWGTSFNTGSGGLLYANFGSADGCPQSNATYSSPCNNGWTVGNIYQVSWNLPSATPLPEIYATSGANANQWKQIKNAGDAQTGKQLNFFGVLTTYKACQQTGGCSGNNNSPSQGWNQLENLVAQSVLRSTDISWQ